MKLKHDKEDKLTLRCKEAIKFLKKTPVSKNQKERLSDLPAYLLIGPSEAGKTMLLAKSDLKFILEKRINIKAMTETTGYDWWVTPKSVIIDTPGNFFASSHNHRRNHYNAFLEILQKQRYKKQISGILVTLSLTDIICQNDYIKLFYENVRQQIINVLNNINRDVPVFLIVNKCDLISGFYEFFNEFSCEERWQPWGFALDEKNQPSRNLSLKFDKEFNKLIYRLNNQLIWRLQYEKKVDKRVLINNFPFQMSQLKPYLLCLLGQVFDVPQIKLQGVFFTSCTQQPNIGYDVGSPSDPTNQSCSLISVQPFRDRTFFVHDLLNDYMINQSKQVSRKANFRLFSIMGAYIFSGCLLASSAFVLSIDFKHQIETINQAQKAITLYQVFTQANRGNTSTRGQLESLDSLKVAIRILNKEEHSKISFLMPKNRAIMNRLKQNISFTYQEALQTRLFPSVLNQITSVLVDANTSPDFLYESLKSYLMIYDVNRFDLKTILMTMQKIWQTEYSEEERLKLSEHLMSLFNTSLPSVRINQKIVDQARRRLKELAPEELTSVILKNNISNQLLSLNLNINRTAASILTFAKVDSNIWSVYTSKNFTRIYPGLIEKASKEAIMGNWIIGEKTDKDIYTTQQINALTQRVAQQYIKNYAKTWVDFLNNIKIIHFTQLDELSRVVKVLGSTKSTLTQLVNLIQSNMVTPVVETNDQLQSFTRLSIRDTSQKASTENMTRLFHDLSLYLDPISLSKNPEKKIFELTSLRMRNQGKDDALSRLFAQVQFYPEPIKSWMYSIGMNIWQLMCYQTQNYINHVWAMDIIPQYQAQLESRFPFSPVASNEASLDSFSYFFSPGGVLDNFYNTYLSPFVYSVQSPWKLRNLDGNSLQFSDFTLEFFQKAYQIQRVYFPRASQRPYISFTIRPVYFEKILDQVDISLGAQQISYKSDQPFFEEEFTWPDYINSDRVKIVFTGKDGSQETVSDRGPWALLRLLQKAELHLTRKPIQYAAKFSKNPYSMIVDITTKVQQNPFSLIRFAELGFPREL